MLVKINKDLDYKLSVISKKSKLSKDIILKRMVDAFILRYEHKNGMISVMPQKKRNTDVWQMYHLYKKHYFIIFGKEYQTDLKGEKVDMRNLKLLRDKMMQMILGQDESDVIAIDERDFLNAFEFILAKMPDWWKLNMFTTGGIYKNLEKIAKQIQHGKESRKNALDDLLNSFKAGS